MIDFKHLQGNLIISATAVGTSYIAKKVGVNPTLLPASNIKEASISFAFILFVTIIGKKTMDQMTKFNWITFTTTGKDKNPNEGFIGPLKNETFGPKKWDFFPQ